MTMQASDDGTYRLSSRLEWSPGAIASVLHALAALCGLRAALALTRLYGPPACGSTLIGAPQRGRLKPFDALAPAVR